MKVKGFHLELTNKCMLKCSACARTTFINKFGIEKWKNHDLNLDHLKKFLDIDLTDLKFNLLFIGFILGIIAVLQRA